MNESDLPQVSEPQVSEPLISERAISERVNFESNSELLSSEPLRDLPSSTHDIPMAVRETLSPTPQVKHKPARLFWGLGSVGAIALLGIGIFFALRPQFSASTAATAGNAAPSTAPLAPNPADSSAISSGSVSASASPAAQMLNHFPYNEAPQSELTPITPNGEILMRKAAAAKFMEMQEAARAAGVSLVPISGFRSQEDQSHVFFDVKAQRGQDTTTRSEVSAPPGYSEHHTGYAVDVGDGDRPDLNLQTDFETDQAFKWLKENAGFYSFEMSFPKNNAQGVSYEPWHWRFVGDRNSLETFYRARSSVPPSAPAKTK